MKIKISTESGSQACEAIYTRGSFAVLEYGSEETPYSVTHIATGGRILACATRATAEWACRQAAMYLHPNELDRVPFGVDPRTVLDQMTLNALAREIKRIRTEAAKRDADPAALRADYWRKVE